MNEQTTPTVPAPKSAQQLTLDWRIVTLVLVLAIGVMLYLWKPWMAGTPTKTITVRGEATISAAPDTYEFQPYFEGTDVAKVTALGNEAVVQVKKLGVADADIKTSVQSASNPPKMEPLNGVSAPSIIYRGGNTSTYYLTVTIKDKALAQKISDYLATTTASGQVTPATSFAKATRSKLDLQARSEAADDAKQKAAVMAKQLGGEVGKVVKISEDGGGYGIYPTDDMSVAPAAGSSAAKVSGATVQPGTDDVSYSFSVVFELK